MEFWGKCGEYDVENRRLGDEGDWTAVRDAGVEE